MMYEQKALKPLGIKVFQSFLLCVFVFLALLNTAINGTKVVEIVVEQLAPYTVPSRVSPATTTASSCLVTLDCGRSMPPPTSVMAPASLAFWI